MDLRALLQDAVIMAPMTKGSNLPYRRLCDEIGATITMGEMALARKLRRKSRPEFALLRRSATEKVFGVQLAGRDPEEMAWAAALAVSRGADLVDVNFGCPIDEMVRRGIGSALLQKPRRVHAIVAAMKQAVGAVPVTAKIRLGFDEDHLNHVEIAKAAADAGADAIIVHGRTRTARYRRAASWTAVGEVAAAVPVPVVGNGDLLWPHEIAEARRVSGVGAVMIARGALIKPWIFREAREGCLDLPAEERVLVYRRYVELGREHWGEDERGSIRLRGFLVWHLGFWCRYVPPRPDGSFPGMQEREERFVPRSDLEALLAREDEAAHAWIADRLLAREPVLAAHAPALSSELVQERSLMPEG